MEQHQFGLREWADLCERKDATIAALQEEVKELEQWVQDQSTANLETMRHTDEMQSRAMEAEQQLTQRTAECDALKLVNDTHMKTVMKLSHVVEQRTAELEALKIHCAIVEEHKVIAYKDAANLQAELERVSLLSSHNERRFEMLDKKYKEFRTLLLALPKVEGEIADETILDLWESDAITFDALRGLLQHRQGMEG